MIITDARLYTCIAFMPEILLEKCCTMYFSVVLPFYVVLFFSFRVLVEMLKDFLADHSYLITVGPRLFGFLDYPDFFAGPNLVMNIY